MNVRRGGLGRGLGALIPATPADGQAGVGARFEEVPVDLIDPNPRQPREVFDEEAMSELVVSIREVGVLQPVVVREVEGGRYQLIMGERRLRASRLVGLDRVPAIIRDTSDDDLLRDALLENLHRQQLNPLEEAAAYQQLLQEFGATHEELAERIGRSRSHVSNTLRLMNLPGAVQRRVAAGVISAGHARALLALDDPDRQEHLAGRIVAEGLSVRAVEEIVTAPEPQPSGRKARSPIDRPYAVSELERRLAEHFDTRVRIDLGRRRGKLTVEFADEADLHRVATLIVGDVAVSRSESAAALAERAAGSWAEPAVAHQPAEFAAEGRAGSGTADTGWPSGDGRRGDERANGDPQPVQSPGEDEVRAEPSSDGDGEVTAEPSDDGQGGATAEASQSEIPDGPEDVSAPDGEGQHDSSEGDGQADEQGTERGEEHHAHEESQAAPGEWHG